MTPEQRAVIAGRGSLFVSACPGSGKTRTIAERYVSLVSSLPRSRGIAVLSFTNAAAEEVARRCRGAGVRPGVAFPNFVGTLDAFVARYLVVPFGSPWCSGVPRVVDSWSRMGIEVRARGGAPRALTLDEIDHDPTGTRRLNLDRVHRQIQPQVAASHKEWERAALREHDRLLRAGYLSCEDVRALALRRVRDPIQGPSVGRALASRFAEVIVDEAQDCAGGDLEILEWLRSLAIDVVVVCDPDQAIFEFRDATPQRLGSFGSSLVKMPMTGNFRSTPAICRLAATLRASGDIDEALGPNRDLTHPVLLIECDDVTPDAGDLFRERARAAGVEEHDVVVLAHARTVACRGAGVMSVEMTTASSRCGRLADAIVTFRSRGTDARARVLATHGAERVILQRLRIESARGEPSRIAEDAGIDPRWLRDAAHRLLTSVPAPPVEFAEVPAWRDAVGVLLYALGRPPDWNGDVDRRALSVPRNAKNWVVRAGTHSQVGIAMTVHAAKGRQFGAVLVALPRDRQLGRTEALVRAWESGAAAESRRVVYVAVTRAERLVGLAVPRVFAARVRDILDRGGVPHEVVALPTVAAPDARRRSPRANS